MDPSKPLISKDFPSPLGSGGACEAGADFRGLGADGGKVVIQNPMEKTRIACNYHGCSLNPEHSRTRVIEGKTYKENPCEVTKYKPWFPAKFPLSLRLSGKLT